MVDSLVFGEGVLRDYKFTSAWTIQKALKESKREWSSQLHVYKYLISLMPELQEKVGEIKRMEIVAIGRDWGPRFKEDGINPVEVIPIEEWRPGVAKAYIEQRVTLHQLAEQSDQPAQCSPEERWAKGEAWAVMKGDNKRALKLCQSSDEAEQMIIKEQIPKGRVEYRAPTYPRCESYCEYGRCGLCPHWRKEDCK